MARGACPAHTALAVNNQFATEQKAPCSTRNKRSESLDTLPDAANATVFERKKPLLPALAEPLRAPPFVFNNPEDL
eukprot:564221-Karenia_brevis.AAC.1